ncbi:MAG: response regulator [Sedimenticola sp.]|nr:response regulator [Sedimenticola sp.]
MEHEKYLLNKRVLVVDDMASIRMLVKVTLQQLGATDIEEDGNGSAAEKRLISRRYDLIICDWDMPGLTGIELLKRVRGSEKDKDTPFIMLTGMTDKEAVRDVIAAKVTDYIAKPFTPEILMNKISRIFSKQS